MALNFNVISGKNKPHDDKWHYLVVDYNPSHEIEIIGSNVYLPKPLDEFITPQDFFDELDQIYGFELDAAATQLNAKCAVYYTREQDALKQDWSANNRKSVWCNPPYSFIPAFLSKIRKEQEKGVTTIALLPVWTDRKWFHAFIWNRPKAYIIFLQHRIRFDCEKDGKIVPSEYTATFPSMIVNFSGE